MVYLDGKAAALFGFTAGGYKGRVRLVENIHKALVQGQAGPQYGSQHGLHIGQVYIGHAQRGGYLALDIAKGFAYFVSQYLAQPYLVVTETRLILLRRYIAHSGQKVIGYGVGFVEYEKHVYRFEMLGDIRQERFRFSFAKGC
jgi:hypothetical protein